MQVNGYLISIFQGWGKVQNSGGVLKKSGGALCYQPTKKESGTCLQTPPIQAPQLLELEVHTQFHVYKGGDKLRHL